MCLDLKLMIIIGQKSVEERKATVADEITWVDEIHKEQLLFQWSQPNFPLKVTLSVLPFGIDGCPGFVLWCVFKKFSVWLGEISEKWNLSKVLITWVKSVMSSGNSWQKGNLCSFITCLYVLLFAFYYQVKISFFYWPSHKPVKSALLHKKEKDTESKARCTKIEHTLLGLSLVLSLQNTLF